MYPLDVCESVATCQMDGPSGHHDVVAAARAPFDTWGVTQPQLRECFVICKLPKPGLKFTWVHLRHAPTPHPSHPVSMVTSGHRNYRAAFRLPGDTFLDQVT